LGGADRSKYQPQSLAQAFSIPGEGILKKPTTNAQSLPQSFVTARLGFFLFKLYLYGCQKANIKFGI
jgi:hypothetical protein